MAVPKKSLGVIVLLIVPCFAIGQNCMDNTTVKQDSIAIRTDSLCQQKAMCKCDTVRIDSCQYRYADNGNYRLARKQIRYILILSHFKLFL